MINFPPQHNIPLPHRPAFYVIKKKEKQSIFVYIGIFIFGFIMGICTGYIVKDNIKNTIDQLINDEEIHNSIKIDEQNLISILEKYNIYIDEYNSKYDESDKNEYLYTKIREYIDGQIKQIPAYINKKKAQDDSYQYVINNTTKVDSIDKIINYYRLQKDLSDIKYFILINMLIDITDIIENSYFYNNQLDNNEIKKSQIPILLTIIQNMFYNDDICSKLKTYNTHQDKDISVILDLTTKEDNHILTKKLQENIQTIDKNKLALQKLEAILCTKDTVSQKECLEYIKQLKEVSDLCKLQKLINNFTIILQYTQEKKTIDKKVFSDQMLNPTFKSALVSDISEPINTQIPELRKIANNIYAKLQKKAGPLLYKKIFYSHNYNNKDFFLRVEEILFLQYNFFAQVEEYLYLFDIPFTKIKNNIKQLVFNQCKYQ